MSRLLFGLSLTAVLFGTAGHARAAFMYTSTSGPLGPETKKANPGIFFQVGSQPIYVSALGFYDGATGPAGSVGDGLKFAHAIGIWDLSGNLISPAGTTIPSGSGTTLTNGFRYVSIPTIALAANTQYYLGASFADAMASDLYPHWTKHGVGIANYDTNPGSGSADGLVTSHMSPDGAVSYSNGINGFLGPNMEFFATGSESITNPAPGGLTLAGVGISSLFGYAWRVRRRPVIA